MKRLFAILAAAVLLMGGCTAVGQTAAEEHVWTMTTAQSAATEGQIIAYGSGYGDGAWDEADEIDLRCTARDGVLMLTDHTGGVTHSGTYRLLETDGGTEIYEITVGDSTGMASASVTSYLDGRSVPTLVISLGDYALYFTPSAE